MSLQEKSKLTIPAIEILKEGISLLEERAGAYKSTNDQIADVLKILFPDGVSLDSSVSHQKYFNLTYIVTKLVRFANSRMTHRDSMMDLMNYAALEVTVLDKEKNNENY
jgi:hypothetical protein